jgi:hypothetical protein
VQIARKFGSSAGNKSDKRKLPNHQDANQYPRKCRFEAVSDRLFLLKSQLNVFERRFVPR